MRKTIPSEEFEIEPHPSCHICGKLEREHTNMKHQFVSPSDTDRSLRRIDAPVESPPDSVPAPQGAVRIASGGSRSDALLRMLLIRKGIITVQELADIEAELTTIGMVTNEPSLGQP